MIGSPIVFCVLSELRKTWFSTGFPNNSWVILSVNLLPNYCIIILKNLYNNALTASIANQIELIEKNQKSFNFYVLALFWAIVYEKWFEKNQ